MFCPNCATQNQDDAKFCRACGADIHLVPQALAGLLPAEPPTRRAAGGRASRKWKDDKDKDSRLLEKGLENIFVGVAFLVIFLAGLFWFRGAFMIWIWFIIPALACVGEGLGQLLRSRREYRLLASGARAAVPAFGDGGAREQQPLPGARFQELRAADTSEIGESPFSVTEGTTRHLAATRADDAQ